MRVNLKLDLPLEDLILLYRLSRKSKCTIGTFIRRCLSNYLNEHYTLQQMEKIVNKPLSEKEWYLMTKVKKQKY